MASTRRRARSCSGRRSSTASPRSSATRCSAPTTRARSWPRSSDSNLFLVALDSRGAWYRYHHLFRELLRIELRSTSPDAERELHRRAAEWFLANGLVEEGLEHAAAVGDHAELARILTAEHGRLMRGGKSGRLHRLARPAARGGARTQSGHRRRRRPRCRNDRAAPIEAETTRDGRRDESRARRRVRAALRPHARRDDARRAARRGPRQLARSRDGGRGAGRAPRGRARMSRARHARLRPVPPR